MTFKDNDLFTTLKNKADEHPEDKGDKGDDVTPDSHEDDPKPTDNVDDEPEKVTFTAEQQKALDAIVKERVAREKKKAEADRKKAEEEAKKREQGQYKELLDEKERELEALKNEIKERELKDAKHSALLDAGYSREQLEFASKNLDGETPEEIAASLEALKTVFPPKDSEDDEQIGFPKSTGNPQKKPPKPQDDEEYGRELARKIRERRNRFKK